MKAPKPPSTNDLKTTLDQFIEGDSLRASAKIMALIADNRNPEKTINDICQIFLELPHHQRLATIQRVAQNITDNQYNCLLHNENRALITQLFQILAAQLKTTRKVGRIARLIDSRNAASPELQHGSPAEIEAIRDQITTISTQLTRIHNAAELAHTKANYTPTETMENFLNKIDDKKFGHLIKLVRAMIRVKNYRDRQSQAVDLAFVSRIGNKEFDYPQLFGTDNDQVFAEICQLTTIVLEKFAHYLEQTRQKRFGAI